MKRERMREDKTVEKDQVKKEIFTKKTDAQGR